VLANSREFPLRCAQRFGGCVSHAHRPFVRECFLTDLVEVCSIFFHVKLGKRRTRTGSCFGEAASLCWPVLFGHFLVPVAIKGVVMGVGRIFSKGGNGGFFQG